MILGVQLAVNNTVRSGATLALQVRSAMDMAPQMAADVHSPEDETLTTAAQGWHAALLYLLDTKAAIDLSEKKAGGTAHRAVSH